jgi:hypothetical protein
VPLQFTVITYHQQSETSLHIFSRYCLLAILCLLGAASLFLQQLEAIAQSDQARVVVVADWT